MATTPTEIAGKDIAGMLLEEIGGQADLLFGLSVALCGGIVALVIQIVLHNRGGSDNRTISLWGSWILALAFLAEGISVLAGYLVKGALVAGIPALQAATFAADKSLSTASPAARDALAALRCFGLLQFVFFVAGIGLLLLLVFWNRKLLR